MTTDDIRYAVEWSAMALVLVGVWVIGVALLALLVVLLWNLWRVR